MNTGMNRNGMYPEAPRFSRESRNPDVPISDHGTPYVDRTPRLAMLCAVALLVTWAALVLGGCGPSEVQLAQALAAEQQDALMQAQHDAQLLDDLERIKASMARGKPVDMSDDEWAAAQRALAAAMGRQ